MGVTLRVLVAHLWVWGRGKGGSSRTWVFCLFVLIFLFIYLFIWVCWVLTCRSRGLRSSGQHVGSLVRAVNS